MRPVFDLQACGTRLNALGLTIIVSLMSNSYAFNNHISRGLICIHHAFLRVTNACRDFVSSVRSTDLFSILWICLSLNKARTLDIEH